MSAPQTPDLDPEDAKLLTLARGALARAEADQGAAVRDSDGRTYAGAPVRTDALTLTALQVAAASALSSGAPGFEAAVLVNSTPDDPGLALLTEISPAAYAVLTDLRGRVTDRIEGVAP